MTRVRWTGNAEATAQIHKYTVSNVGIGDVFTLTVTGFDGSTASIEYTAVDTSAATVSAALVGLWEAATGSLFNAITATGTVTVVLTADILGAAFKVASSATGVSPTFVRVATTANGGPNDWSDANNWSEGTVPGAVAGEDTFVEDSSVDILYGLDQSGAANTLTSLRVQRTFTGVIGWNGATGLVGDYLQVKATKAFIGEHFSPGIANGSGRIKLDFGSTQTSVAVDFMASSTDSPKPAFRMLADNALTDIIDIKQGSVGIAFDTGEASTVGDVQISFNTNRLADSTLEIGNGTTIDNLKCLGGESFLETLSTTSDVTLVTSEAGTLTISGTGAVTTLAVDGGIVKPVSSGLITTCTISSGTVDFTASSETRNVTTLTIEGPGILQYDKEIVTIANKVEPPTGAGRQQIRASKI